MNALDTLATVDCSPAQTPASPAPFGTRGGVPTTVPTCLRYKLQTLCGSKLILASSLEGTSERKRDPVATSTCKVPVRSSRLVIRICSFGSFVACSNFAINSISSAATCRFAPRRENQRRTENRYATTSATTVSRDRRRHLVDPRFCGRVTTAIALGCGVSAKRKAGSLLAVEVAVSGPYGAEALTALRKATGPTLPASPTSMRIGGTRVGFSELAQ